MQVDRTFDSEKSVRRGGEGADETRRGFRCGSARRRSYALNASECSILVAEDVLRLRARLALADRE